MSIADSATSYLMNQQHHVASLICSQLYLLTTEQLIRLLGMQTINACDIADALRKRQADREDELAAAVAGPAETICQALTELASKLPPKERHDAAR